MFVTDVYGGFWTPRLRTSAETGNKQTAFEAMLRAIWDVCVCEEMDHMLCLYLLRLRGKKSSDNQEDGQENVTIIFERVCVC